MEVYDVTKQHYPEDYSKIDAVVISGSVSAAYDKDAWIERLQVLVYERERNIWRDEQSGFRMKYEVCTRLSDVYWEYASGISS